MPRLFTGLEIPGDVGLELSGYRGGLPGARWIDPENYHITLRFIGEVERPLANDVATALARVRFPAFELAVKGVGRFEQRSGGALWAGVEPRAPVAELAAKIERACVAA